MFVSKQPNHTNKSSGENKNTQRLISAKPAVFEETLLRQQWGERRPSQTEANAGHLRPRGWQTSTRQPNLTCHLTQKPHAKAKFQFKWRPAWPVQFLLEYTVQVLLGRQYPGIPTKRRGWEGERPKRYISQHRWHSWIPANTRPHRSDIHRAARRKEGERSERRPHTRCYLWFRQQLHTG